MLDRFHKISEIVASFAIVGSLIFVGIQVSQNTDATRISNSHAALDSWNEITLAIAADKELVETQRRGVYPELREYTQPDINVARYHTWLTAGIKAVEHNYLQWLDGNLSDELWHGYRDTMTSMLGFQKLSNDYWSERRQNFSAPFRALMDELVVEAAAQRARMIEQARAPVASEDG